MVKALSKIGMEGAFCNIVNATYEKYSASSILYRKILAAFLLMPETRQGFLFYHCCSTYCWKSWPELMKQEKELRGVEVANEEVKYPLFSDDMIMYIGEAKDSKKLLELIK